MLDMQWWGCSLTCPECNIETVLGSFAFSADGGLQMAYECSKCKRKYKWEIFATQLAHKALLNDIEKARRAPQTVQAVRPPLLLKLPLMSEQDKKDAHDMGIDWDRE